MLDVDVLTGEEGAVPLRVAAPVVIGRGEGCGIRLKHWRVARRHASLALRPEGVFVEDLGSLAGTQVNGRRIVQYGPLLPEDEIFIGMSMLRVRVARDAPPCPDDGGQGGAGGAASMPAPGAAPAHAMPAADAAQAEWRRRLHVRLLDALDLRRRDVEAMSDAALRAEADRLLEGLIQEADGDIPASLDREALRRQVVDEAVGLGPLESLLADPAISEIMVNRYDELYVERKGVLARHPAVFSSDQSVLGVIERIVSPLGRRIDEASPMVDARLRDGSRVNAVIAPLALKGPALTIRKFPARRMQIGDLVAGGSLDHAMAEFLQLCVERRKNIVVSGGTGSGKTTLLNILSNFIPAAERVITIEDAAELKLAHEHLVALEARPANLEGRGAVSIRDLVRNALRMRPDRIVVGECRGAEAIDMLQAMNTGHEGSLTTLHANTPRDAMSRLETMVLMAGMDLPLQAIREQIVSAVDIVVQQSRSASGHRRVTAIVEVCGQESGRIQLQELFRFERPRPAEPDGPGYFQGGELMPSFFDEWRDSGVDVLPQLFCGRTPAPQAPLRAMDN
ncbi:Putative conjugal transfer protein/MT3759 [Pigmentiphaga humi]|uniref:Conjugal transfer protein/MT3759 n=1 Tax=Pigmentiphaga humi TaxID=2478468 RepID=A0A3P4B7I9_9BURK|nr:ATPase, T2SS/T4P/T4SS family [Pigmentiphaga humi]VCU71580.1 Putative conjugal transfer protein/MT3759 [Pigmentiphaga humi]